jgi:ribosome biogenesis GTPase
MTNFTLTDYGFDAFFQQKCHTDESVDLLPVRVVSVHNTAFEVSAPGFSGRVAPPVREHAAAITVGDWLLINEPQRRAVRLLERKSLFKRVAPGSNRREQLIAANIDTVFIVSSCNLDFNPARIERYLALAHEAGVMPVVVLSKADLCDSPQDYVGRAARLAPALVVEAVNSLDGSTLGSLRPWLGRGQTIALLGSSGVGKSTLSNTLMSKSDPAEMIATATIRDDDDKGRHTTTSRFIHQLPGSAWLLDTPGMRELQLVDVKSGIDDVFAELAELALDCRFSDCGHSGEPGCAIQAALDAGLIEESRILRWSKLRREEAHSSASIAERRERGRQFGKLCRSVIKAKKSQRPD